MRFFLGMIGLVLLACSSEPTTPATSARYDIVTSNQADTVHWPEADLSGPADTPEFTIDELAFDRKDFCITEDTPTGRWHWWCSILPGRYSYQHDGTVVNPRLYVTARSVCASGMAFGEIPSGYTTPPLFCLTDPDSSAIELTGGGSSRRGAVHFCHCSWFEVEHGSAAMRTCYAMQAKNGDTEDENICPAGGLYAELTTQSGSLTSVFRYNKEK